MESRSVNVVDMDTTTNDDILQVREMTYEDVDYIVDYFVNSSVEYWKSKGADKSKFPSREKWRELLISSITNKSYQEKQSYYIIWLYKQQPIGHTSLAEIQYGDQARMHLHLWSKVHHQHGWGVQFLQQSMAMYFENFKLKRVFCEPLGENLAPNKTLPKLGFEFIKTYETTPGWINFYQRVNRYELTREEWFRRINNPSTINEK